MQGGAARDDQPGFVQPEGMRDCLEQSRRLSFRREYVLVANRSLHHSADINAEGSAT